MQCSLSIEPSYGSVNGSAFHPYGDSRTLSTITAHPDITDSWDSFQKLIIGVATTIAAGLASGGVAAAAVGSATLAWVSDQLKSGTNKKYGAVSDISFPEGGLIWCRSSGKALEDRGDNLLVHFRAWSEDEIKSDADGKVQQPSGVNSGIADQGGGYHQTSGTFFYDRSFLIPVRTLPVGIYSISFAATDDGWFFDVGVSEVLYVKVTENQHPRPPATPKPVTVAPPTAAEMKQLLSTFDYAQAALTAAPANPAPKRTTPRLDGRAPVSLDVAMAIPFAGQQPGRTPGERAATRLAQPSAPGSG